MMTISSASCVRELGAAGVAVDLLRLLPLLDHLGEKLEQFRVGRLTLAEASRGDVAILDGGGDEAQRRDAALVLRLGREFQCGGDGLAHGSDRERNRGRSFQSN